MPEMTRRRVLHMLAGSLAGCVRVIGEEQAAAAPALPGYRVMPDGWGKAGQADVTAVLNSAAASLWQWFPGRKLEPFLVIRGHEGPIVLYERNARGEIVLKLDAQDWYWCQYVYQFAHEFCHILSGFNDDPYKGNNWFEESVCETASLWVLRTLSARWAKEPPYPNWRAYAPEFTRYADDVMNGRVRIGAGKLPDFVRKHRKELVTSPTDRDLNGAVALALLPFFEAEPRGWGAVAWLNSTPSTASETFEDYLRKWHGAIPDNQLKVFAGRVIQTFDVKL